MSQRSGNEGMSLSWPNGIRITFYGGTTVPTREERQWQHHEANKAMRKVHKQIKRNRKPDRVRRKEWMPGDFDDPDAFADLDLANEERVMPLEGRTGQSGRGRACPLCQATLA